LVAGASKSMPTPEHSMITRSNVNRAVPPVPTARSIASTAPVMRTSRASKIVVRSASVSSNSMASGTLMKSHFSTIKRPMALAALPVTRNPNCDWFSNTMPLSEQPGWPVTSG
jgi:hypothetical protein